MKKIWISIFILIFFNIVFAQENSCSLFSVDYINDDGTFKQIECFDDFQSAENKRKELGDDYVVRNDKSLSPMKIISMGNGFAYTYTSRNGSSIQNIYEKINEKHNGTGATTYVSSHYEMTYKGTEFYTEHFGYSGGYVKVVLNGFEGFADLEYVDLVPIKFIEKGLVATLGGNDKTTYNEEPFDIICKQNYYEAKRNGNYIDLIFNFYRSWAGQDKEPISSSINIGVAPSFMVEGQKYYSDDGINFYNDMLLTNLAGTYYNYYQFLPARTYTNIDADTMNKYIQNANKTNSIIEGKGQDFIDSQNKYGVNAATILSMAIHESAWGTSNIARNKNNLFGWGAYDDATSNAKAYSSVKECIEAQMGDNLANYLDNSAGVYYSMSLGNKGGGFITKYASDPYWAEKISHYYYELDKFSKNYDGTLTDFNTVNLALVNTKSTVYKNNIALYSTENKKNGYQKNLIVPVLEHNNDFIKIQTSNPISDNTVLYPITLPVNTLVDYNKNDSIGFIETRNITPLNYSVEAEVNPNFEVLTFIDTLTIDDSGLYIKGSGILSGRDYDSVENTKYELIVKKIEDFTIYNSFQLNTIEEQGIDLNDGYNYQFCGFEGNIDLTDFDVNKYVLYLRITNQLSEEVPLRSFNINNVIYKQDNLYRIVSNTIYGNRLELQIMSTTLDYSSINKPEARESLFAYDKAEIIKEGDRVYLDLDAVGMIYYLNYDNINNLQYNIYLVKDSDNIHKYSTTINKCDIDYSSIFKSLFNMDNICFNSKIDITDLYGKYDMILEIINGENKDYLNFNTSNFEFNSITTDKNYSIIKTSINNETQLVIS